MRIIIKVIKKSPQKPKKTMNIGELKTVFRSTLEKFKPLLSGALNKLSTHISQKCQSDPSYQKELLDLLAKLNDYGDDAIIRSVFITGAQELIDGVVNLFYDDMPAQTRSWFQNTLKDLMNPKNAQFHYLVMEGWKKNILPHVELIKVANPQFWKMVSTNEWGKRIAELKIYDLWMDKDLDNNDRKWAIDILTRLCEFSDIYGYTTIDTRKKIEKFTTDIIRDSINGKGFNIDVIMDQMQSLSCDALQNRESLPDILEIFKKLFSVVMVFVRLFSGNQLLPNKLLQIVNTIQTKSDDKVAVLQECKKVFENTDFAAEIGDPEASKLISETMEQFGIGNIIDQMVGKPDDLL